MNIIQNNVVRSHLQQEVRWVVNTHDQTPHTQHVIYIRETDQADGGQMMNEHDEEILQEYTRNRFKTTSRTWRYDERTQTIQICSVSLQLQTLAESSECFRRVK